MSDKSNSFEIPELKIFFSMTQPDLSYDEAIMVMQEIGTFSMMYISRFRLGEDELQDFINSDSDLLEILSEEIPDVRTTRLVLLQKECCHRFAEGAIDLEALSHIIQATNSLLTSMSKQEKTEFKSHGLYSVPPNIIKKMLERAIVSTQSDEEF